MVPCSRSRNRAAVKALHSTQERTEECVAVVTYIVNPHEFYIAAKEDELR